MATGGDAARARRRAQRRNAANVRSGRYQPQFRADTSRARAAATRLQTPPQAPQPVSLGDLKAQIKAKKARVIGDAFKFGRRGSDNAVDKYPASAASYYTVLAMTDEEFQDFYDTNESWDEWKFLFYH
jgi:hypothetical protein